VSRCIIIIAFVGVLRFFWIQNDPLHGMHCVTDGEYLHISSHAPLRIRTDSSSSNCYKDTITQL